VGLFFADAADAEPQWVDGAPLSRGELSLEVKALLEAAAGVPPLRPLPACEALGCGFRFRCHTAS
jgi:hypothetical protein